MQVLKRKVAVALSSVLLLAACSPAGDQGDSAEEQSTATRADIEAVLRGYTEALNSGDSQAWFNYFADDVLFTRSSGTINGRAGIEAWAQPIFDSYEMRETITPREIVVSGDWAFANLDIVFEGVPKSGGDSVLQDIRAIFIFESQPDNSWKIAHGMLSPGSTEDRTESDN
ncbi:MAG: nuclear transport factor 2 family protein [Woeseiaceae bacterium]